MDRMEFLRQRQTAVGSSDAPGILGLGWKTPHAVYLSKVEPPDDRPPAGPLARGIALEPIVAAVYAERVGVPVRPAARMVRHRDAPWLAANIDFEEGDGEFVEIKTTVGFGDEWGPPGTDRVPDHYYLQVQQQLGVTDRGVANLAALDVAAWELRVYRIGFDAAVFDHLLATAGAFWHDHVLKRVPPGPAWLRRVEANPPPIPVKGKRVALGADIAELAARRADLKAVIKEADAEVERLDGLIEAAMGDAHQATAPGWKFTRSYIEIPAATVQRGASAHFRLTITPQKEGGNGRRPQADRAGAAGESLPGGPEGGAVEAGP